MAVNPHAETYQGKTQFSGPIKAGSRWMPVPSYDRDTVPGTIAVTDLPNTGYVVCSQSCAIDQKTLNQSVTNIALPAGSMILSIQIIVTTAFDDSGGLDLSVGTNVTGYSYVTIGNYVALAAVGVYDYGSLFTFSSTWAGYWKDVSTINGISAGDSIDIRVDSDSTSVGRAILTINYVPGLHLSS